MENFDFIRRIGCQWSRFVNCLFIEYEELNCCRTRMWINIIPLGLRSRKVYTLTFLGGLEGGELCFPRRTFFEPQCTHLRPREAGLWHDQRSLFLVTIQNICILKYKRNTMRNACVCMYVIYRASTTCSAPSRLCFTSCMWPGCDSS